MSPKLKNLKLTYRKLKISDYEEFKKLFYDSFNKKISFDFFKWRYFKDKSSFCYGAFSSSSNLIANVGIVAGKLNNNEKIFSRHSSMVLKEYRGIGIFSILLEKVKKIFFKNVRLVVMWPNKNNFSSFGLDRKNIITKKYYLYKTSSSNNSLKKTNYHIDEIKKFKNFIKCNDNFFLKNLNYFKKRYTIYKKHEYKINKFQFKNNTSFFILKHNKDRSGSNYVILDHFGSKKIIFRHLLFLIANYNNLIFISKKEIHRSNYKLLDYINFKVGFIKRFNVQEKKSILDKKVVFLGDTDIFLTIR
jgi:hypothetical protein